MKKIFLFLIFAVYALMSFQGNMLNLKIGSFTTDMEPPDFGNIGMARKTAGMTDYYVVQFKSRIMSTDRDQLLALGAEIFDYIPDDALIVKLDHEGIDRIKGMKQVKFMQIWQPAYRIEPSILDGENKATDIETDGKLSLKVGIFNSADLDNVMSDIRGINGTEIIQEDMTALIKVDEAMFRDVAIAVASIKDVYWVERAYPEVLHNTWSRWIMDSFDTLSMRGSLGKWYVQMSLADSADSMMLPLYAHGIYGQNQIIGDDDTGLDWDNVYFRDEANPVLYDKDYDTICENPSSLHRKIIAYNVYADTLDQDASGHGTHTSGSAAGDSLGNNLPSATFISRGTGMAPLAKLAFCDIGNSSGYLVLPSNYGYIYTWMYNAGARITTSSWGQIPGGYSSYTLDARNIDFAAWNHKDMLMFRSAGNANNDSPADSCNSPATAKNIVTVGASESGAGITTSWINPGSASRNELLDVAEFSSHGPTKEGQLKPEIIGTGGWYIFSADSDGNLSSNNNGITYMGGTSMSTPTLAGFGALARQYFTEGWYPTGTLNAPDAFTPSGALIKAMMVNATRNSPGNYSTSILDNSARQNAPSMGQGWGRVTMSDAIYFAGDVRDLLVYDETTGFSSGSQYDEYTFFTGNSVEEYIKIVLSWTDYPASTSAAISVVNDLDLTVFAGGNTYLGNVFAENARSEAGGARDSLNVTEVVWLDAIPNSYITVRVDARNVPNPDQPYALVITGDLGQEAGPGVNYRSNSVIDTFTVGTVKQDNALNNGETAQLEVWITNSTGGTVTGISGLLKTGVSYCTVLDSTAVFGDLNDNDTTSALFSVSVDPTAYDKSYIPFELITAYGASLDTTYFSVQIQGTNIISVSADSIIFDYNINATSSSTIYVKHADSTSVREFTITDASMKNASSWITSVTVSSADIAPGDSSAITVSVDTTGLIPLTTYMDTLVITTDADSSKAAGFSIPVILITSDMAGITDINRAIPQVTGFELKSSVSGNVTGVFALASYADVQADIIDITGRTVNTIASGYMKPGYYSLNWRGNDDFGNHVSSGIYFLRIAADKVLTEKIVIVK